MRRLVDKMSYRHPLYLYWLIPVFLIAIIFSYFYIDRPVVAFFEALNIQQYRILIVSTEVMPGHLTVASAFLLAIVIFSQPRGLGQLLALVSY